MAKPFIKWAGGKTRLLTEITKRLPESYQNYFEPFVGGGSLYWHLLPKYAYLSDINAELVNCYLAVKYNPTFLMADLHKHIHTRDYFFSLRNIDRSSDFQYMGAIELPHVLSTLIKLVLMAGGRKINMGRPHLVMAIEAIQLYLHTKILLNALKRFSKLPLCRHPLKW